MSAALHAFTPATSTFDPHLASAWRISQQEVRDAIMFMNQYSRVISERDEMLTPTVRLHGAAYVEACEKLLTQEAEIYLRHVRVISETEAEMTACGMAFARSSDAWGE